MENKKNSKKKPSKNKTVKKTVKKKDINKSTINKKFEEEDFKFLTNNKLVYGNDNKELLELLHNVWECVQRSNTDVNRFNISIIMLFSTIAEMFLLAKDRTTRLKQKKELYSSRIKDYTEDIEDYQSKIDSINLQIREIKEQASKSKSGELTHMQKAKIHSLDASIKDVRINIRGKYARIRSAKASMQLIMYEVNEAGQVYNDVTTHLLSKNERIIKLLKEFGLAPSLAPISSSGTLKSAGKVVSLLGEF